MVVGGDGPRLDEELVDAHQSNDVTTRDILDWLSVATHHQDGPAGEGEREKLIYFHKLHYLGICTPEFQNFPRINSKYHS